jgi:hypothetical protein
VIEVHDGTVDKGLEADDLELLDLQGAPAGPWARSEWKKSPFKHGRGGPLADSHFSVEYHSEKVNATPEG